MRPFICLALLFAVLSLALAIPNQQHGLATTDSFPAQPAPLATVPVESKASLFSKVKKNTKKAATATKKFFGNAAARISKTYAAFKKCVKEGNLLKFCRVQAPVTPETPVTPEAPVTPGTPVTSGTPVAPGKPVTRRTTGGWSETFEWNVPAPPSGDSKIPPMFAPKFAAVASKKSADRASKRPAARRVPPKASTSTTRHVADSPLIRKLVEDSKTSELAKFEEAPLPQGLLPVTKVPTSEIIEKKLYDLVDDKHIPRNARNPISYDRFVEFIKERRPAVPGRDKSYQPMQQAPELLPAFLRNRYRPTVSTVRADGNSGFRVIAHEVFSNGQMWPEVRRRIMVDLLLTHFSDAESTPEDEIIEFVNALNHFQNPADDQHRLTEEMLPHVADTFARPIVSYVTNEKRPAYTYLPLSPVSIGKLGTIEPTAPGKRAVYLVFDGENYKSLTFAARTGPLARLAPVMNMKEKDPRVPTWVNKKLVEYRRYEKAAARAAAVAAMPVKKKYDGPRGYEKAAAMAAARTA